MQSNSLHMTQNPLIIYICSVTISYMTEVATGMLLRSTITLTVWRTPCCSEFNIFDGKHSLITVCLPVVFELSMADKSSKTVCAIDRLRLRKHCIHSVSFQVVIWSPSVPCIAVHKQLCKCTALPYHQNSYRNRFLFLLNFC